MEIGNVVRFLDHRSHLETGWAGKVLGFNLAPLQKSEAFSPALY